MRSGGLLPAALLLTPALLWLAVPASAGAKSKVLKPVSYPDTTTYSCRTDAITIHPGQNLNLVGQTKPCPNAQVVSGPGGTDVFSPGSRAQGTPARSDCPSSGSSCSSSPAGSAARWCTRKALALGLALAAPD